MKNVILFSYELLIVFVNNSILSAHIYPPPHNSFPILNKFIYSMCKNICGCLCQPPRLVM